MTNYFKSWINLDITHKPFSYYSNGGTKVFSTSNSIRCYMDGTIKMVNNREGNQVVSNLQLYIKSNTAINIQDSIIVDDTEYDIKALSPYYRNGKLNLLVVYL